MLSRLAGSKTTMFYALHAVASVKYRGAHPIRLSDIWEELFVTKIEKQYERFRELIVAARKAAGLTQVEVAARLKQPQSYVSKYESGVRRLDVIEFIQVAEAIGFDPADLVRRLSKS